MDFLLQFIEAVASVPDPIVVAGHILAAVLILTPIRAYGAGVSWGMGLWLLGVLLDDGAAWTPQTLSAQAAGSLSGNLLGMWVVLTVVESIRAIRSRWSQGRARPDRTDPP